MAGNVDLTLRLLFEDKATAGLRKLGGTLTDALSVGAITAFGVASVKAFADAEASQRRLTFAFQKFPAMNNIAIGSLRELNTELMKKTGYDDDAIASGQAVLAQFKLTGQQVAEVTPLLVDYAAQQGIEIPAAAMNLGKALLGNAKALKNIGIAYKSTGDSGKDYAAITELIREQVGGFADDEATTAAGALRKMQTAYENVQEAVGGALAPALADIASLTMELSDEFATMTGDLTELTQAATDAGSGLRSMVEAGRELPGAMPSSLLDSFGMGLGTFVSGITHADDAIDQLEADLAAQGYTLDRNTGAITRAGDAADGAGRSFALMGDTAKTSANAVKQLDAALQRIGGKKTSIAEAMMAVQDSFDAATEAAKKNGKTLSMNTAEGRDNRRALIDIAKAADEAASAYAQNGKSADYVRARTKEARAAFIDAAVSMGATKEQARNLAREYGLIPKKVTTAVQASGIESALSAAAILKQRWQEIINLPPAVLYAHYQVTGSPPSSSSGGRRAGSRAGGPLVYTPPAPPAWMTTSGPSIGAVVRDAFGGLQDKIDAFPSLARLQKALKAATSDKEKEAIKKQIDKLKELQDKLAGKRGDLRDKLKSERDQMRADAIAWAQDALQSLRDTADQATQAYDQATQALADLQQQRADFIESIASGFRQSGAVTTFAFADAEGAAAELQDARRAYNIAMGTNEEAAALERLNAAKKAAADAEANNTPGGVLASMNAKLASVRSLASNLRKMQAMGYPTAMIRDVLSQGIEGARLAEVLASADPGTVAGFQEAQAGLDAVAADLGQYGYALAGSPYDNAIVQANADVITTAAAKAAADAAVLAWESRPLQINLTMDGKAVVQMLQNYRRSTGGAGLGLG